MTIVQYFVPFLLESGGTSPLTSTIGCTKETIHVLTSVCNTRAYTHQPPPLVSMAALVWLATSLVPKLPSFFGGYAKESCRKSWDEASRLPLTHQLVHSPRSLQFEGGQRPQTQLPGNIDGDQQVSTGTDTHPEHQVLGEGNGGEELHGNPFQLH